MPKSHQDRELYFLLPNPKIPAVTATLEDPSFSLQTHPDRYRHFRLSCEGDLARLEMAVDPNAGLRPDHELKLNSYDLGVDIELADAIQRIRFEHPEVRTVVVTGALDRVFCAGANIPMLATSTHAFKVNFCKFTNETRLGIEDASAASGVRFLAALNGTASGGGYELALACDKILLVDDRSSTVSFPELPLLGVLPGTGGLTRIADKRKIRRDRNDVFSTLAEGIKGKRAVEWDLVDRIAPLSRWDASVQEMARELADEVQPRAAADQGVALPDLTVNTKGDRLEYEHLTLELQRDARTAAFTLRLPKDGGPRTAEEAHSRGCDWWIFALFRELDHALCHMRFNEPSIGTLTLRVEGDPQLVLTTDELISSSSHWFVAEVRHFIKRVLKRFENTARSFYAVVDRGTAFCGTFLELALACDRTYLLNDSEVPVFMGVSSVHDGTYPMANGLTRLETRFLADHKAGRRVLEHAGRVIEAQTADELGLATFAPDEIDWEDELRLALEERTSFSPDALTGMESNLRFAGPETLETKIFGRLSAWQNWIFQRPNAVGPRGALQAYGTPQRAEFNYDRT
ncbi:MAG: benzoyl-CoA-dihydrodiol lyase [Planctomycetes bacterium]|nr:benzoyl-CoA-dihydrodiol lyase [Planctomycetota bacterium]